MSRARDLEASISPLDFLVASTKAVLSGGRRRSPRRQRRDRHRWRATQARLAWARPSAGREDGHSSSRILPRPPDTRAKTTPGRSGPRSTRLDYGHGGRPPLLGGRIRGRYLINTRRSSGTPAKWRRYDNGSRRVGPHPRRPARDARMPRHGARRSGGSPVLIAMGFVGPEPSLPEAFGLQAGPSRQHIHDDDFMTTRRRVRRGRNLLARQSLVVWPSTKAAWRGAPSTSS